ncbi:hypothetical protein D3C72_1316080 [compost metagenome]
MPAPKRLIVEARGGQGHKGWDQPDAHRRNEVNHGLRVIGAENQNRCAFQTKGREALPSVAGSHPQFAVRQFGARLAPAQGDLTGTLARVPFHMLQKHLDAYPAEWSGVTPLTMQRF